METKEKLIAAGVKTRGKVTAIKICWWLKINTKAVRANAKDGALFPHIMRFTYEVDGREYRGRKFLGCEIPAPSMSSGISVYYDKQKPKRYTVVL